MTQPVKTDRGTKTTQPAAVPAAAFDKAAPPPAAGRDQVTTSNSFDSNSMSLASSNCNSNNKFR